MTTIVLMFRVSAGQMQVLSSLRQESFVERTVSHLRERFATEWKTLGLREQELKSLVLLGIDQARSFGVVSEPDVRLYVECMVLFHPDFARDPRLNWAGKVLGRKDLSGTEKMEQIHNHLVFASPEGRWP